MNPSSRLVRHALATALIASLCHQGAQAAAQSSSVVGALQYTLIDLTPDDGVTPYIIWQPAQFTQNLSASLSDGRDPDLSPNVTESHNEAGASQGPQSLTYQGFDVTTGAAGLNLSAQVDAGGRWNQSAIFTQAFVLSANTAVTFTAMAQNNLGVDVPAGSVVQDAWGNDTNGYFDWAPIQAHAMAVLYAGSHPEDVRYGACTPATDCLGKDFLFSWLRSYTTVEQPEHKQLQLTVTNNTGGTLASNVVTGAYLDGYATAPLTMVPEASSAAQMLWGLGLLAMVNGLVRRPRVSRQH